MNKEEFKTIVNVFNCEKHKFVDYLNTNLNYGIRGLKKRIPDFPDYYDFESIMEFKWWMLHSEDDDFIESRFCPICGTFITKSHRESNRFYCLGCSPECSEKIKQQKAKEACLLKYGFETPAKNKDIRKKLSEKFHNKTKEELEERSDKSKQTKKERYGDENYNNRKKSKITCLEKYGVETYLQTDDVRDRKIELYGGPSPMYSEEVKNKAKQTRLEKYGAEYIFQNKELCQKAKDRCVELYGNLGFGSETINKRIQETNKERYGDVIPARSDQIRNKIESTNIERYSVSFPLQNSEIHRKTIVSGLANGSYIIGSQHAKETRLRLYGDENYNNSEQISKTKREHFASDEIGDDGLTNKERFVFKMKETKKKNKTSNTSKSFEDKWYDVLIKEFPNLTIERQYYCDRYPFQCDFYIQQLDLFIEMQGEFYHNYKPFTGNSDDIEEYNRLMSEGALKQRVAKTWRYSDPKKRRIAKENSLNYIEFWEYETDLIERIRSFM